MAKPSCSANDARPNTRRLLQQPSPLGGIGEIPFFLEVPAAAEPDAAERERFLAELEADPKP